MAKAMRFWKLSVEVVCKTSWPTWSASAVLPRRWVVERTFAWLVRWRRFVRDYEQLPETHEAFVKWAMIGLMAATAWHGHPVHDHGPTRAGGGGYETRTKGPPLDRWS